jgi:hypothetical protein
VHRSTARDASDNSPHVTAGEGASIGFLARWLSGIAPSASGRLDSAARWAAKARSAPDHPPDTLADGGRAMGFATGDSALPPPPERLGPTHCTRRRPASIEATRPTARQARAARHVCYVAGRALGDSRNSHHEKRLRRRTRAHGVLTLVASAFPACGATPTSAAGALSKSGTAPFALVRTRHPPARARPWKVSCESFWQEEQARRNVRHARTRARTRLSSAAERLRRVRVSAVLLEVFSR